jgi:coenzyme F420 hydrogenase subunit beta
MNNKLTLDTKNIEMVVKKNLCTGCGTCAGICPKNAIQMIIDHRKGIYLPQIVQEECSNCGICYNICPGHEVNFKLINNEFFGQEPDDPLLGNYLNCYTGYATDYEIRYNSASGGLITALLIFALEEGIIDGALVTKMRDDHPLEPQPFIARTREEIISASGSKYCPVSANIALREILKNNGRYAIVGLPCHLHGIRKAELIMPKLKERIVLHVGILCAKTISFLGTQYQLRRMGIKKENLEKISYRGKGWPGNMTIVTKNNQRRITKLNDYYDDKFGSFIPHRCTLCMDKAAELADISFGDAWLPEIKRQDKVVTSIIISRNIKGADILQKMVGKKQIEIIKTNSAKVKESNDFSWKKTEIRARFSLTKLLGKEVPDYHQDLLPSLPNINAIVLHSQMFLTSRRYLWQLLEIYSKLLKYGSFIKSKLKL